MAASGTTTGISIVCVFNDPGVREHCLDRSIDRFGGSCAEVEYISVDNVDHAFPSAGAALNHGAKLATRDVIVFAHQDVYLHSLPLLERAAAELRGGAWGMIGAVGITPDGTIVGRMRDRVVLIGGDSPVPTEVDSVDEVLFMARRDLILRHPLSEEPDLSWHAYAVEYGLRLRTAGLPTGAMNLGVTHNSLTINLARLEEAHRFLADQFPEMAPVQTTCGVVGGSARWIKSLPVLRHHGWRYRWLRESALIRVAQRQLPPSNLAPVLSDIRLDVDLLNWGGRTLHVVSVDGVSGFGVESDSALSLQRREQTIEVRSVDEVSAVPGVIDLTSPDDSLLVTNLSAGDLEWVAVSAVKAQKAWRLGHHESAGFWMLVGPMAQDMPYGWHERRAVPAGSRSTS